MEVDIGGGGGLGGEGGFEALLSRAFLLLHLPSFAVFLVIKSDYTLVPLPRCLPVLCILQ